MPGDSDFTVNITADTSGLVDSFEAAKAAGEELKGSLEGIGEGGEGLSSSFEGIGEAFAGFGEHANEATEALGKMSEGWAGLLGVVGGGAVAELMNHIAETTMELGDSMLRTGAALGVGIDEARGFNEAMSSLGVNSTAASMAIKRLEMDAGNGGKKLAEIGVSARDASGELKTGSEIFGEVIDKLQNMSSPAERSAAGFALLGRGAVQLLGVLPQISSAMARYTEEQKNNDVVNQQAVASALQLHDVLTQLKSAWEDAMVSEGPKVVEVLKQVNDYVQQSIREFNAFDSALKQIGAAVEAAASWLTGTLVNAFNVVATAAAAAANAVTNFINTLARMSGMKGAPYTEGGPIDIEGGGGEAWWGDYKQIAEDQTGIMPSGEAHFTPGGGGRGGGGHKGHKKGGGGGGGDPMAGLDESLDLSKDKMNEMAQQFQKLGSEAMMAAKEGGQSFDQLRADATADYQKMQEKYKEFTDAVQAGNKQAAQDSKKEWQQAAQDFEKAWKEAAQKAQSDMQQFKSMADSMANEVSGILNTAISGKVNWAQELDKILSQMISSLTKHLFEMAAQWIMTEHSEETSQNRCVRQNTFVDGTVLSQGIGDVVWLQDGPGDG